MNAPAIPKTLPSAEDIALARESGRALSTVLKTRADIQQIDFHDDQGAVHTVSIPTSALRLLLDVLTEIGQGNQRLAQVSQIRRFHLLTKELDHDDGEVTATMKVRRSSIYKTYAAEIEALYR